MAYIGRQSIVGNFVKLDAITAVNGQAAYTMQNGGANFTDYSSVNQFLVSLNGTIQAPTDSFTVSGSTLTFASNLSTGDVIDFVMCFGNSLSAGTPTDATVSTAKIVDDAITAAKLNNDIISGSTELASEPADTDEFLVSDAGTLKRIDYSLIKGGGKVLQVVYAQSSTEVSSTNTTFQDVVSASITPSATSSKVLVLAAAGGLMKSGGDTQLNLRIIRDSTAIGETKGNNTDNSDKLFVPGAPINELDEPSSTSSLTYKLQIQNRDANGTVTAGQNGADSSLTLMEIAG